MAANSSNRGVSSRARSGDIGGVSAREALRGRGYEMLDYTPEGVMRRADEEQVRFVNLQFTDITGAVKSVTIPIHQFADSLEHGTWFDGSSIEGFARIAESD